MPTNEFRAQDFLNTLRAGSLPLVLKYTGLVKEDDKDKSTLLFSLNNCQSWIQLHQDAIESVEYLGVVACRDHEHALVTVEIKQPTTPEGVAIARLADHASQSAQRIAAISSQPADYDPGVCGSCLSECTQITNTQARKACINACNLNACK